MVYELVKSLDTTVCLPIQSTPKRFSDASHASSTYSRLPARPLTCGTLSTDSRGDDSTHRSRSFVEVETKFGADEYLVTVLLENSADELLIVTEAVNVRLKVSSRTWLGNDAGYADRVPKHAA